ncbi:esterase [Clostridia bacterium]|nr:esterase [Clostridia bacterium]
MAIFRAKFYSEVLEIQCNANVIYPQRSNRSPDVLSEPPAILYLLHGLSDDHNAFLDNVPMERLSHGRNLMIVMAATGRAFYTNQEHGYRYFDFFADELPSVMSQFFSFSHEREKTFAAGFSMGGYGALKLGLTYPERYGKVAALAPVVCGKYLVDPGFPELVHTFGDTLKPGDDLLSLSRKASNRPKIYLSVGTEDELLDGCRAFENADEYHEIGGAGHTWDYVQDEIPKVLNFLGV